MAHQILSHVSLKGPKVLKKTKPINYGMDHHFKSHCTQQSYFANLSPLMLSNHQPQKKTSQARKKAQIKWAQNPHPQKKTKLTKSDPLGRVWFKK